jgi:hypothetical protein
MEDPRVTHNTTLKLSVKQKLRELAPFFEGGGTNDVIEYLVEKEWEARNNEVASKRRYNNREDK